MTRWERRDAKKVRRMPVHGRQLGTVYAAAILKRKGQ